MGYKIGVVSQKGGVGKSTLARALAVAYANADWLVKIADLDHSQSTSYQWQQRRIANNIQPEISVEIFGSINHALKQADHFDLYVFDGAPHATSDTLAIAKESDLVLIPTGFSLDDMEPAVILANELVKQRIPANKIAFAFCRTGDSDREHEDARDYLGQTTYQVLPGYMQEKTAFRRASDEGKSAIESQYKGPREQAEQLVQSIIDKLNDLIK